MTMRTLVTTLAFSIAAHHAAAQTPARIPEPSRSVTMPLAEYNRLLDLVARAPGAPAVAPVPAVVASADLKITVDRDIARGVFTLTGQVLQPGVSRVPLLSGATLIDATAGGRPVPLIADGQALTALIPGPNPFALALEWGGPLAFRPGRASFVLPVPQAGSARATIEVAGEQADIRLSAGLITRRTVANGRTVVEATLDPGSATEVWWSMRDSAQTQAVRDVRALAEIMTLITLNDSDVRMVALIDVTVAQGELRTLTVRLPKGYELMSITGSSLEGSTPLGDEVVLAVGNAGARSHQFLVNLERPHPGGTFDLETGLVSLKDVQRERGEIGVEGAGTMDLASKEPAGVHRMDVRELNRSLHALARLPILSAFRYQRPAGSTGPVMSFGVRRFADAGVLAAVADSATATTLITSEGRALTEVQLVLRNRAQGYLRVELPPDSIVSVELAGQTAKPASAPDGVRVPLMRNGLNTSLPYTVSFVYLHSGTPFQKKGDIQMSLPKMDIPIGVVHWEVFVPEQYTARAVDGNVIDAHTFRKFGGSASRFVPAYGASESLPAMRIVPAADALPNQIRGRVVDQSGAVLPGVTVQIGEGQSPSTRTTDERGEFAFSGVAHGQVRIEATLTGFAPLRGAIIFDGNPIRVELALSVAALQETVTVVAAPEPQASRTGRQSQINMAPSVNVMNLQQRAAGVLPIRVDVPRAGMSHEFIKPLVVGDETVVKLRYKRN